MQRITHRRALNKDSEVIKKILKKAFEEYAIQLPDGYSFADIDNLEEEYFIASGEFVVLTREQRIIGFFALLPSGPDQVELTRLYLKADERGKGLGEFLLNLALETARKAGYEQIHLETTSRFFQAVGLYRKFGFRENDGATVAPGHDIGLILDLG